MPLDVLIAINVPDSLLEMVRAAELGTLRVRRLERPERRLLRGAAAGSAEAEARLAAALAEAEVLLCDQRAVTADLSRRAPRLRWIQVTNAGVDYLTSRGLHRLGIPIATAKGVHGANMAEYVMMMALAFTKRLHLHVRAQQRHEWSEAQPDEVAGRTMGIVGLGNIGRAVARAARAFGMRVVATRRRATGEQDPHVDRLYSPERLHDLLAESDFVLIATPLTTATFHLIGEAELRAMKTGAVLMNIARGAIVDEGALVRALQEGRIGGAGLDVFEEEPLPPESPLWGMENVLITPHMAGNTPRYYELVIELFCRSLKRYLEGGEPLSLVDVEAGY